MNELGLQEERRQDFFSFSGELQCVQKTKARASVGVSSALRYRLQTIRSTPAKTVACEHEPAVHSTSSSHPL